MPQGYDFGPVAGELLSDSASEPESEEQPAAYPGTPSWVKAFVAIALALLTIFAALHIAGRGLGGHMHAPQSASEDRR